MEEKAPLTQSELYRMNRPEYFSDSETIYENELPKEHMAFEIEKITTNNKQDDFENLCRKLSEKLIAPNLIPQVGPTGGGDGKTDSETYPVSEQISNRWFVPENGWNKNEKWAFAFSAKKDWKPKVKSDVAKIINTEREYSKIFFITNQTPSSKQKKDTQDELINKHKVEVIILDGKWILDKVYDSNLQELVIETLNLSNSYSKKTIKLGGNDANRIKELEEIENNINDPNRYSEYDYQLVEDSLRAAILSRMLEKSRDEIEGKFDRAVRLVDKTKNKKQKLRIHYQRAWTYLNWYDDVDAFLREYISFKKCISDENYISEIELLFNLLNLLKGILSRSIELKSEDVDYNDEIEFLFKKLDIVIKNNQLKPSSALIAKTYKALFLLTDKLTEGKDVCDQLSDLSDFFGESVGHIDYPFDSFKEIVEKFGIILIDNKSYDDLIDLIASISEKRTSELASAEIFIRRAGQQLRAKSYKKSIIYFGKAIFKLSKEESLNGLYLSLKGLSTAYYSLGLIWASNNCLAIATSLTIKSFYEKGIMDKRTIDCVKELAMNELQIGRIPSFLCWNELFLVLYRNFQSEVDNSHEMEIDDFMDACLAIRLVNTRPEYDSYLSKLPDLLNKQTLFLSEDACLYRLGYNELIAKNYGDRDLDKYFQTVSNNPFRDQMIFDTNFLSEENVQLKSIILGCTFLISIKKNKELVLFSEMLLAYLESFLATSLTDIYPSSESITIEIINSKGLDNPIKLNPTDSSNNFTIEVDIENLNYSDKSSESLHKILFELLAHVIGKNFYLDDMKGYLKKMFVDEEVNERQIHVLAHPNLVKQVLGNNPKILFDDWFGSASLKDYPLKRKKPIQFKVNKDEKGDTVKEKLDLENLGHDKRVVVSVIDSFKWDKAGWLGFGVAIFPQFVGIVLPFKNESIGIEIFKGLREKIGDKDKDNLIEVAIIKGINKNKPHWYRVHLNSRIKKSEMLNKRVVTTSSRIHEMNAENETNLKHLTSAFQHYKKYKLMPGKLDGEFSPYPKHSIEKYHLRVKNAWEIGINDEDSAAINKNDDPIIPTSETNPPILELLNKLNGK